MSDVVESRTPSQCRTHHQKMLLRYGSIDSIIVGQSYLLTKKIILQ
jgi:hypothetical protein